MKINVLFAPETTDDLFFKGKTSVVIDVLRASNTIITALANGAREMIPVISVDAAVKISKGLFGGTTLLGGERNTKKIEGFQLGNSPLEYTPEKVGSKSVILFTTNGTKAILKARLAETLMICSFSNITSVVEKILFLDKDVEILCAGNSGLFAMEDIVCAGMIVREISNKTQEFYLSDAAKAALLLFNSSSENILGMLKDTEHGKVLLENGYEEDIKFCSNINTTEVIPYLSKNVIKLLQDK
jgi:2-phosphosulfolactate phosphatase